MRQALPDHRVKCGSDVIIPKVLVFLLVNSWTVLAIPCLS